MSSSEAANLANVSPAEINKSPELLKHAIAFYSSNVKNYAKWFEISEISKNEDTFTSYKVVYRVLISIKLDKERTFFLGLFHVFV